jgi:hypothetical protein
MSVQGVDLSPIQPSEVPSNCSFHVQNIVDGWDSDEKFDLIHARAMIIAFADWLQFFKDCYRYRLSLCFRGIAHKLQTPQTGWLY